MEPLNVRAKEWTVDMELFKENEVSAANNSDLNGNSQFTLKHGKDNSHKRKVTHQDTRPVGGSFSSCISLITAEIVFQVSENQSERGQNHEGHELDNGEYQVFSLEAVDLLEEVVHIETVHVHLAHEVRQQ